MGWRERLWRRLDDEVRPSIEKMVGARTVLYRPGDRCIGVGLIREGEVELVGTDPAGRLAVALRRRGGYVGDEEMLGDGIWRRTARTMRPTRLEMLSRDVFLGRIGRSPGDVPSDRPVSCCVVRILPASPATAAVLPPLGVDVVDYPFIVGRGSGQGQQAGLSRTSLLLDDREPYRLSRRQFAIVRAGDGVALTDSCSRLGTFVDGKRLGHVEHELVLGSTVEIVAGGLLSPFRFHLSTAHGAPWSPDYCPGVAPG